MEWSVRGRSLTLDRPVIMGILNVTPDSFSDSGRFFSIDGAVARAASMLEQGADIIDIGGESTRPGAAPVAEETEVRRVLPVMQRLVKEFPAATFSIDTVKSGVARAALDAGARIVNDVSGLRFDPAIADVCASAGAGLILMHSRGADVTELASFALAIYGDVVGEVVTELTISIELARRAGVRSGALVVDPGIGFAKRSEQSLAVLSALPRLAALGHPIMVGVSNKRFIGEITGIQVPADRLFGTLGANVSALALGARIFRVHDVRQAREALDVAWAILHFSPSP